jgi:hypothetical protein
MLYDFHRKSCRIMALMRSTRKLDNVPVYLCPTVSELPDSACEAGSEGSPSVTALSNRRNFHPTRRGLIPRMAHRGWSYNMANLVGVVQKAVLFYARARDMRFYSH